MTFEEMLESTPMMRTSKAIPILTHLTLTQYGALSSENLDSASQRISKHLTNLMLSSDNITKRFFAITPRDKYKDDVELEYESYLHMDENNSYVLVNFLELFDEYNKHRGHDGLDSIKLSPNSPSEQASVQTMPQSTLIEFATAVSQVITNIVARDDLLKADTLGSILDEGFKPIVDSTIIAALPKIKSELSTILKGKITKGRLSSVVDKKIHAGIHLADTIKGEDVSDATRVKCGKEIMKFDLPASDRNHVVDVFVEYRKATKQE